MPEQFGFPGMTEAGGKSLHPGHRESRGITRYQGRGDAVEQGNAFLRRAIRGIRHAVGGAGKQVGQAKFLACRRGQQAQGECE